jgi:hypothetical protein
VRLYVCYPIQDLLQAFPLELNYNDLFRLWSLTAPLLSGSLASMQDASHMFRPLINLLEAWTRHVPELRAAKVVLRLAAVEEQLAALLSDVSTTDGGDAASLPLDPHEQTTANAEAALARFRSAQQALSTAVSDALQDEAVDGGAPPRLVQERDEVLHAFRGAVQVVAACRARVDLDSVRQLAGGRRSSLDAALDSLGAITGVKLQLTLDHHVAMGNAADVDAADDIQTVATLCVSLRHAAAGVALLMERAAALTSEFARGFTAYDEARASSALLQLHRAVCSIMALDNDGDGAALADVLRRKAPRDALLRRAAAVTGPLRAVDEALSSLQRRAAAVEAEHASLSTALAARETLISSLKRAHKEMKQARRFYAELKLQHSHSHSDDDSDDSAAPPADQSGADPEQLTRARRASTAATRTRDEAARALFLAAKAYHPETLLAQRKRLRMTGLSSIWSERRLDDYEQQFTLPQQGMARHSMVRATYEGSACILKLVQLQQGQALCKEAEVLRRLDHPNIVKLEAAFAESSFLYLHFPSPSTGTWSSTFKNRRRPQPLASPLPICAGWRASCARPWPTWPSAALCTATSSPPMSLWMRTRLKMASRSPAPS